MAVNESASADIKQILEAFDRFVNLIELDDWVKDASVEHVKSSFKLTGFIENSIKKLQEKQCLDAFLNTLAVWWKAKNRTKVYDIEYYNKASDHLLSKFFANQFTSVKTTDVAVRIYTTLYPKERFQNFLQNLMCESLSYKAVLNCAFSLKSELNLKDLEHKLALKQWSAEISCGRGNDVKKTIRNMLSSYKIELCLPDLIGMLALQDISAEELTAKQLILEEIHTKMANRSILSRHFWRVLFKNINKEQLSVICLQFEEFLKELLDFIIYSGCMMNFELDWASDPATSICPDITYDDLVQTIKFLCNCDEKLRKNAELRISQAKSLSNLQLWVQLEREIWN